MNVRPLSFIDRIRLVGGMMVMTAAAFTLGEWYLYLGHKWTGIDYMTLALLAGLPFGIWYAFSDLIKKAYEATLAWLRGDEFLETK